MNKQEIFEKVVRGLIEQGGPSYDYERTGECAYRGSNGRKCAAGLLIEDSDYDSGMEDKVFFAPCGNRSAFDYILDPPDWLAGNVEFINQLQVIHDDEGNQRISDEYWKQSALPAFIKLGKKESILTPEFKTFIQENIEG